jgi:hypothetical protein
MSIARANVLPVPWCSPQCASPRNSPRVQSLHSFKRGASESTASCIVRVLQLPNARPRGCCGRGVCEFHQESKRYASASTISFSAAHPPTFSAAALATAIDAPTPNRPLEDTATVLAGAATSDFTCGT